MLKENWNYHSTIWPPEIRYNLRKRLITQRKLLQKFWEFYIEYSSAQSPLSYFDFDQISQNYIIEKWAVFAEKQKKPIKR